MAIEDLTGKVFGEWTVVQYDQRTKRPSGTYNHMWKCRCSCGTERSVEDGGLRRGRSKSCGCLNKPVIPGHKYGKLTAIRDTGERQNRHSLWLFKCDCGNETVIKGIGAKSGGTKSCGCLVRDHPRTKNSSFRSLLKKYKHNASIKGLDFALTIKEFAKLTKENCFYCGSRPETIHFHDKKVGAVDGGYEYNGIDRVDNEFGYFSSNCVPCCTKCNRGKRQRSQVSFLQWAKKLLLI